jgi:catechol 2,3-dioxygenase-like lactoylglutathione lyase family enzyme
MLHHAALETREADADACAAFFALLGFERVEPPPTLRGRAVWLARGTQQIHLLLTEDPVVPPSGHVAVVVDDYEATVARLGDVDHRAGHWGSPRCYARDPAGHTVEVMAFPPP